MIAEPAGTSWPSSHPGVLTAFTRVAARELGARAAPPRAALTGLDLTVATSRVYLGVHYPSDVAGGLLLGRAIAALWPGRRGLSGPDAAAGYTAAMLPLVSSIGWPVLDRIRIGDSFAISPHGLFIAIGFIIGAMLLTRLAPRRGITEEHIQSIIFWCLIGAIIGSRLFYVLAHFSEFDNLGADARDLARRHQPARRDRRRDPDQPAAAAPIRVPVLPGRRPAARRRWRSASRSDGSATSSSATISASPRAGCWRGQYSGGTLAPPFVVRGRASARPRCRAATSSGSSADGATLASTRHGTRSLGQGVGVHQTALYDMILAGLLFAFLWYLQQRPRREGVLTLTFGALLRRASACSRTPCASTSASVRSPARSGPRSPWWSSAPRSCCGGASIRWSRPRPNEVDGPRAADAGRRPRGRDPRT